jgi:hypothetical protein
MSFVPFLSFRFRFKKSQPTSGAQQGAVMPGVQPPIAHPRATDIFRLPPDTSLRMP